MELLVDLPSGVNALLTFGLGGVRRKMVLLPRVAWFWVGVQGWGDTGWRRCWD